MIVAHDAGYGMTEISELEDRLREALATIDSAIAGDTVPPDVAELRQQNHQLGEQNQALHAQIAEAERAAAETSGALEQATAELELVRQQVDTPSEAGDIAESIVRLQSSLDDGLRDMQSRLDDSASRIADLAEFVSTSVQDLANQSTADQREAADPAIEEEMNRLRQSRKDDVAQINVILEQLVPLVEGESDA